MHYKTGLFQAALGAICTLTFIISSAFGSGSDPKARKMVGTIQKTGAQSFTIQNGKAKPLKIQVSESAAVFLNEKAISFATVESGRQASVRYVKQDGQLFATEIDIFPVHSDFESGRETVGS